MISEAAHMPVLIASIQRDAQRATEVVRQRGSSLEFFRAAYLALYQSARGLVGRDRAESLLIGAGLDGEMHKREIDACLEWATECVIKELSE